MSTPAYIRIENVRKPFTAYIQYDGHPDFLLHMISKLFSLFGKEASYFDFEKLYLDAHIESDRAIVYPAIEGPTEWDYCITAHGYLLVKHFSHALGEKVFHPLAYLSCIKNDCKTKVAQSIVTALIELEESHKVVLRFPKDMSDKS